MKPAFTHCALHVHDLDASIAFYRSYCGLDIVKEHGEGAGRTVWLASPGAEQTFCIEAMMQDRKAHAVARQK